jgi:hypothetical protein
VRCLLAVLSAVGALTLAGCTFDTSGIQIVSDAPVSESAALEGGGALEGAPEAAADLPQSEAAPDLADLDAGSDQPALDLGPADQPVPDQPALDQPVPDQPAPDLPVDLPLLDQALPDQPAPDLAKPPCNTTYGSVSGYMLCEETATECTFFFTSGSCDSKCQAHGGTCIKAAAEDNNTCKESYSTTCDTVHGDGLCTCTR